MELDDYLENIDRGLPKSIKRELNQMTICNDVILNFLFEKDKGTGKIDYVFLKANKIPFSLNSFMDKQSVTSSDYVDIVEETDNYFVLKITDKGRKHYLNNSEKYKIKRFLFFHRLSYNINKINKRIDFFLGKIIESKKVKILIIVLSIIAFCCTILKFIIS